MDKLERIGPATMLTLGVGWLGAQFFWGFHSGSMPLFLKDFTDSKFKISLVLSLPGLAGCIVPPIVGYFSDRTLGRFGRRRPYIFFGMLGVLICILGLPRLETFGTVATLAGLIYFSLRIAETPYLSLLPDVTPPQQRSTTSGVMNLLGAIGLISYFVIGSQLWDMNPSAVIYMVAAVAFGAMVLAILLIKEPVYSREERSEAASLLHYLKGLAQETNVLKFFIAQFFWWLGFWIISSFLTLFVVEGLGVPEGESLIVPMVFAIVATVFMLPLGMLGDRLGRKGIISCMLAFWAIAIIFMGLSRSLTQAAVTVGVTGIPYAAIMGVGYAYLLDLIPKDRTAEFVGMSIISVAAAQIFGPLIGGKLIDVLGYRSIFPTAAGFMVIGLIILQFVRARQAQDGTEPAEGK